MQLTPRKILVTTTKWLLGIVLGIILLLGLAWGALQTRWGQEKLKQFAVHYLQGKLKTVVRIGSVEIKWFTRLVIRDLYLEDQQKRPLLQVQLLDIGMDLSRIWEKRIGIPVISLEGGSLAMYRAASDSSFNFSFIPAAFSTADPAPADTTGSPYIIQPGKVSISRLRFLMDDQFGGQVLDASLAQLKTEIDSFDLEKMAFHTRRVMTDSLRCAFRIIRTVPGKATGQEDSGAASAFSFGSDSVIFSQTDFTYQHIPDQFELATLVGALSGKGIRFDLASLHATALSLQLLDHKSTISMRSKSDTTAALVAVKDTRKPFTFSVNQVNIARNAFRFDDQSRPVAPASSVDMAHLDLQDFNLQANTIQYDGKVYAATIDGMNLRERSGFRLIDLQTRASYADTAVSLQQFIVKTNQNELSGDARMSYASLGEITSRPAATRLQFNLNRSRLQLDELLYFSPDLKKNPSFQPLLGKIFYLNTRVDGQLNKLHIPELVMVQDRTRLLASADLYELPDTKKLRIDLRLKEFSGYRKDLLGFLPKHTIPDSVLHYIPEKLKLTGTYTGSLNNLFADLKLQSSSGNVSVKGSLKNVADPKHLVYDLNLQTQELKLGELLQDSTLGNITASIKAKGSGTDLKTATADLAGHITEATYNGYRYTDIDLAGKLHNNILEAEIDSRDPNLALRSKTTYNMNKRGGSFNTATTIRRADLYRLGFFGDTLTVSAKIDADIPQLDSANINGQALVSAIDVEYGGRNYILDTISLSAVNVADTQAMALHAPFMDATLKGRYALAAIPAAVQTIMNRYLYTRTDKDTSFTKPISALLNAQVHIPDSLFALLPGVKELSPFALDARIDTDSSILGFITRIPNLRYNDLAFDSVTLAALYMPSRDSFQTMKYVAQVKGLTTPSFNLEKSSFEGTIKQGVIDGKIELDDAEEKPRYIIPYTITNNPGLPVLQLGDSLLINRQGWGVNSDNIVYLNRDSLKGSRLVISNKEESISILADSARGDGLPLTVNINQFRLKNISDVFISDTSLIEGTVNGNLTLLSFSPFQFTSRMQVDSLQLKEVNAGTLAIDVREEVPNEMLVDVSLKGSSNDVTIKGDYQAKESMADLQLNMASFDLRNVAPFLTSYLSRLTGRLTGAISATGKIDALAIRGNLKTDSVDLVYKDFATQVRIPSGELLFTDAGLKFNQFEFLDSAGHKGRIEGGVAVKGLNDYQLDTRIITNRFLVIDKKKNPDQLIYGPTWADALITLKGNQDLVNIEGSVKVIDSSMLTYIYSSDGAAGRGEGLIEFFDPLHPTDTIAIKAQKKTLAAGPKFAINTYINVTPTSTVTIVLDEYSGDQLVVKGTASINFAMSAGGSMNLIGNYEVESGDYDLSLAQLIRKKFKIQKGSTITWSGDPLKAEMNLTAMYAIKTTAAELVNDIQDVPGIDKQKLNFEVYLLLTKELLKPDINFRLDMAESDREAFDGRVYNRIRQVNSIPSDLNKQVMGLLALNHFISDNPFSSLSSTGSSTETAIYATAGRMLTQELTELVGQAVKGVDIDFDLDVNEDYNSSGTMERNTDLKMGVRKSLADNRLQVYVGSTFALEGQNQEENALSGLAGDITLEYMLSKDGKYRIKGFRVNEREVTFEGTIVKTGVTFVVVLEFNKFRNAFKRNKNKKRN